MPLLAEPPVPQQAQTSPYVGAVPFQRTDQHRFFGREREAEDLASLVIAHPVVLLYAQSGAGKTSLINARLIPMLEDEDCEVLPPVRLGGLQSCSGRSRTGSHSALPENVLLSEKEPGRTSSCAEATALEGFLARSEQQSGDEPGASQRVVIFDQFEELFTIGYHYSHANRMAFFQRLRAALDRDRLLRILICMREDYMAELEPYARSLADGFRTRFRLERLRREAALRALTGPLRRTGYKFAPGVAEKVVTNLLTVSWTDRDGKSCETEGEFVEPVQLGVVSEFLWARVAAAGALTITEEFVGPACGIDEALEQFYEHCIRDVLQRFSHVEETTVRSLFQHHLIREGGIRAMCLKGRVQTEELPNSVLERLEALHLIRSEWRANAEWYELTHDRFIPPVQQANRRWIAERLRPEELGMRDRLEVLASEWESGGRCDVHLLRDSDLGHADTLLLSPAIAELALTGTLRSCIEASRRLRHTRELRQLRRQRLLLSALVLCAVVGSVGSWREYLRANLRTAEVEMGSALGEVRRIEGEVHRAGDMHEDESAQVLSKQLRVRQDELRATMRGLEHAERAAAWLGIRRAAGTGANTDAGETRLHGHLGQVFGVSYSGSGLLVSASADGTARVWNPATGTTVAILNGHTDTVADAIFSGDGKLIATAGHDGTTRLWESLSGKQLRVIGSYNSRTWDIAFSPDSRTLATASEDGFARVWDTRTGKLVAQFSTRKQLFAAAFDPGGTRLATGGADGVVRIWDVAPRTRRPVREFREHSKWVWSLAFSPDRHSLASAGFDGKVIVRDLEDKRPPVVLTQDPRWQLGVVAFAPTGTLIAVGSSNGTVTLWDYRSGRVIKTLAGNCGPVYGVSFSPDGLNLAAGCQQRGIVLFTLPKHARM